MPIGYFKASKTGKTLAPEAFIKRETVEWIGAIGGVIKVCTSHGKQASDGFIIASEKDIKKMLASAHNFQKRRR